MDMDTMYMMMRVFKGNFRCGLIQYNEWPTY